MSDGRSPRRGEIWSVDFEPVRGSETGKQRPALVISSDGLSRLPVRIVVPLTGWQVKHDRYSWRVRIDPDAVNGLSKPSVADVLQVRVVSLQRFNGYLGGVRAEQLAEVVAALALIVEYE